MEMWWAELDPWLRTAVVVGGGFIGGFLFRMIVMRPLDRFAKSTDNDVDDRFIYFVKRFSGLLLFFCVTLAVLEVWGIDYSPLLAGAGIAGIALGLAAKETLSDIFAGVFLIVDRPIRVGDRVKLERIGREWGSWGDVVEIGLRRTRVRNTDGVIVDYPNAFLASSVITNFTIDEDPVRVRIRFAVDYGADIERVCAIANAAAAVHPLVMQGTNEVVVRSLWDDSRGHQVAGVLMELRYKITEVRKRTKVRSTVLTEMLRQFQAEQIPMAAATVHIAKE